MYLISSAAGNRHKVNAEMPDGDTAVRMWKGQELAATVCGRSLIPVNFYEPDDAGHPRFRCVQCFGRSS